MSKGIVAAALRAAKRLAEQVEHFARPAVEAALGAQEAAKWLDLN